MSEVGAVRCGFNGCYSCDFLPYRCVACDLIFCHTHFAFEQHNCTEGSEYLAKHAGNFDLIRESAPSLRSEISYKTSAKILHQSALSESSENLSTSGKDHFSRQIRSSATLQEKKIKAMKSDENIREAKSLVQNITSLKSKRIGTRVSHMLCKSRSRGDPKLRMEDRFFLEVQCCCTSLESRNQNSLNGNTDSELQNRSTFSEPSDPCNINSFTCNSQYLYFSRYWSVGRTLDAIQSALAHQNCPCYNDKSNLILIVERTGKMLESLNANLFELSPNLEIFDTVTLIPRKFFENSACDVDSSSSIQNIETEPKSVAMITSEISPDKYGKMPTNSEEILIESSTSERFVDMSDGCIKVVHGKKSFDVPVILFTATLNEECNLPSTVVELKRSIQELTSVPWNRQKLLLKGSVLNDGKTLADAGVTIGSKIMVLGIASKNK